MCLWGEVGQLTIDISLILPAHRISVIVSHGIHSDVFLLPEVTDFSKAMKDRHLAFVYKTVLFSFTNFPNI